MIASGERDGLDLAIDRLVEGTPRTARRDTLRELLRDEYFLGELEPLARAVDALEDEALDLVRLRRRVTSAIRTRHPAIARWLVEGFHDGLPDGIESSEVDRFLHRIVLLEALMRLVVTRPGFVEELHAAMARNRENAGLRASGLAFARDVQRVTGGFFEGVKLLLLEIAIDGYLEWRAGGETVRTRGLFKKNLGLDLNILEATLNELFHGFWSNARVGFRVLRGRVRRLEVRGPEQFVRQWLPDQWTRRYHSWNLAFFVGNIDNLDLLLPKLFVPSVIDAEPQDYLYLRAVSIWFMANVVVHVLAARPDRPQRMPTDRALAERLGALNLEMWSLTP